VCHCVCVCGWWIIYCCAFGRTRMRVYAQTFECRLHCKKKSVFLRKKQEGRWNRYVWFDTSVTYLSHICKTQNRLPVFEWGRWFCGIRFFETSVSNIRDRVRCLSHRHWSQAASKSPLQLSVLNVSHANLLNIVYEKYGSFFFTVYYKRLHVYKRRYKLARRRITNRQRLLTV